MPACSKAATVKTAESARKTMAQMLFLVSGCSFGSRSSRERDSGRDEVFSMTVFLYLLCGRAMSVGNAKCLYYNVCDNNMKLSSTIFREYDIRGVAGKELSSAAIAEYEKWYGSFPGVTLTLEAAEAIGRAYGIIILRESGKKVVVGHEMRPFAEELNSAFISGIRKSGCSVVDLGKAITPLVYFHAAKDKFDGGTNITGSHNVYFFNGFKMMKKNAWPIYGAALQEMHRMIEEDKFPPAAEGSLEMLDGYAEYRDYFLSHLNLARPLKIVIDCGNGSAGMFAPELFRALGCEVVELYTEVDASFPNHVPDPEARQSLKDLQDKVIETKADLGVAFDADGDRVGFIDESGVYVEMDYLNLIFARDFLSRHPGKKILFDVKCSQLLTELVTQWGGVPLMHRTGHAPIKETLRKDPDIIFGGEASGHFYFVEDYFKIDDGLWAAGKMLEIFSKTSGAFSRLVKFPERIRTPELKLPCADEKKFKIIDKIREHLSSKYLSITLDGLRFQVTPTSWGLVRASNTSPYLTLKAEGVDAAEVLKVKNILADELEKFPEVSDKLNRSEVATLTGRLGWV